MTEKPILFSDPMVTAILDGRKTMTRRVLKPQPNMLNGGLPLNDGRGSYSVEGGWKRIPYAVGDLLWVKETWWHPDPHSDLYTDEKPLYRADGEIDFEAGDRWRSPRFMPRWASRITLRVNAVTVEKLQDISEDDAKAEGAPLGMIYERETPTHRAGFRDLWDSLNATRGFGWDAKPWVAVYSFERVTP